MADLLSAIVGSSKALADQVVGSYAAANRTFRVVITRPGSPGAFNRDTGTWTGRTRTTIYDGPARIWQDAGTGAREIGDEQIPFNDIRLSINQGGALPRVDDVVHVVDDTQSQDTNLAGRDFEVTGVEVGGFFAAGVTLTASGAAPSRHDPA